MNPNTTSRRFVEKLRTGLAEAEWISSAPVIAAVSGGHDSTAMLLGLHQIIHPSSNLIAAHYNHKLRGADSEADENFVHELCNNLGITLHIGQSDTENEHLSEDKARNARHAFLADLQAKTKTQAVVVAHTLEDQAETVLLRLTRGAGIRGIAAMQNRRTLKLANESRLTILRPMLQITHAETRSFLESIDVKARHDVSNDDWKRFARNRIRHCVIPELTAINQSAVHAVARLAQNAHLHMDLIDSIVDEAMTKMRIDGTNSQLDRQSLIELHPAIASEVLNRIYTTVVGTNHHLDQSHINSMLRIAASPRPADYDLPGNAKFESSYRTARISKNENSSHQNIPYPLPFEDMLLPIPGSISLGNGYTLTANMRRVPDDLKPFTKYQACLSPDILDQGPLVVRCLREADMFNPLGMDIEVRLQKFLINSKVPQRWRKRLPIVTSNKNDKIAWIAGVRIAEWAKVLPEHQQCVHLELKKRT